MNGKKISSPQTRGQPEKGYENRPRRAASFAPRSHNSNRKVPTAAEVRAQGPVELTVCQLGVDDPSLPPPPKGVQVEPKRPPNPRELHKLIRTKMLGGLVPQRGSDD